MASTDASIADLKRTARTGKLRAAVEFLERIWRSDQSAFQGLLADSLRYWGREELIPIAFSVLIIEQDDPPLHRTVVEHACRSNIDSHHLENVLMTSALWGDESAREKLLERLNSAIARHMQTDMPTGDLLWTIRRSLMIGWRCEPDVIDGLAACVKKVGLDRDTIAMLDALSIYHCEGYDGLRNRLAGHFAKQKYRESEIESCFILGCTGDPQLAPFFLELHHAANGGDFWSTNIRVRALASYAYSIAMEAPVQQVAERWLRSKIRKVQSRWFGGALMADFANLCQILWNCPAQLSPEIISALQAVAAGAHKHNACSAIALLLARQLELPTNPRFDPTDFKVRFGVDFVQYDSSLSFVYYWRCKAKIRARINQAV